MRKLLFIALLFPLAIQAQILRGTVVDASDNSPLPGAIISIEGVSNQAISDMNGQFELSGLKTGLFNVSVALIGYDAQTQFEVLVTQAKPAIVNFNLREALQVLDEVEISAQQQFKQEAQSPVSVQSIGINEIQRNPGGNQDISKVIQSLPGVASGVAFRNDLIIRGGGPNENRFYLDGIEIPAINHFATQGASGGPVGMINVNFIRDVDFYTSAFPAQRGNSLSSIMEINLKDGRTDKTGGIFQIGASEVGLTLDGPINKKTTYLASIRRSYLQFLFKAIGLPFLPTYNDYQFKVKHNFDRNNQLTILSLGAYDVSILNTDQNETPEQRYILNYLPEYNQWNYSIGAKYTHFGPRGITNLVLSRFMLNNESYKFENNDRSANQLLNYASQEIENKFRLEHQIKKNRWESMVGFGLEQAKYNTQTYDERLPGGFILDYSTDAVYYKANAFANWVGRFAEDRLKLSLGLRTDIIDFNASTQNPLNQLSPRLALSYSINENWTLDGNYGIYYQLPPYTALGYTGMDGNNADLSFIQAEHFVLGSSQYWPWNAKTSIEGFYKRYSNYPFLLRDSISLATVGGDFGVIGNQLATSTSDGRAFGLELTYQQKLYKGLFGIAAITLVRSEFQDILGDYVPSSWDNGIIATFTFGKRFGKNYEIGMQYQHLGGAPYTPFDLDKTATIYNWDVLGRGIPNYGLLNTQRLGEFDRLNIRIDKKWFLKKVNIDLYFDLQNALAYKVAGPDFIDVVRDNDGNPVINPDKPWQYQTTTLPNVNGGTVLPSVGFIFEF
ncbi:TonB-dependent receptor [Schleiferiaceae bacterium]|nr:TonB-dependent receptor [Schleiferiaceae bacterium]